MIHVEVESKSALVVRKNKKILTGGGKFIRRKSIALLLFYWYLFITLLAYGSSITTPWNSLIYGTIYTWVIYLAFFVGSKFHLNAIHKSTKVGSKIENVNIDILTAISVASLFYGAFFYTGNSFDRVVSTISHGGSVYNEYQAYFLANELDRFSVSKIPVIIGLFIAKISMIYMAIKNVTLGNAESKKDWLYLLLIVVSYLFFSLSRGTTFEFFEIGMLFIFCVFMKNSSMSFKVFKLENVLLFAFLVAALIAYEYNLSARYSFEIPASSCSVNGMCFDPQAFISTISQSIGRLTARLSGYFVFGTYYLSQLIENYWLVDKHNFISLLLPLALVSTELHAKIMCEQLIDCGVSWTPSIESYIYLFGMPLSILFFVFLGYISKLITVSEEKGFLDLGMLYLVFFLMVSLPVGNFITNSSSNLLSFLSIVMVWLFFKLKNRLDRGLT